MALEQSSIHSIHSIRADKLLGALSREESWWDSVFNVSIFNVLFGFCIIVAQNSCQIIARTILLQVYSKYRYMMIHVHRSYFTQCHPFAVYEKGQGCITMLVSMDSPYTMIHIQFLGNSEKFTENRKIWSFSVSGVQDGQGARDWRWLSESSSSRYRCWDWARDWARELRFSPIPLPRRMWMWGAVGFIKRFWIRSELKCLFPAPQIKNLHFELFLSQNLYTSPKDQSLREPYQCMGMYWYFKIWRCRGILRSLQKSLVSLFASCQSFSIALGFGTRPRLNMPLESASHVCTMHHCAPAPFALPAPVQSGAYCLVSRAPFALRTVQGSRGSKHFCNLTATRWSSRSSFVPLTGEYRNTPTILQCSFEHSFALLFVLFVNFCLFITVSVRYQRLAHGHRAADQWYSESLRRKNH